MYVNHRPAFGLSPFDLNEAFTQLGSAGDEGFAIDRDRLLSLLQNKGMRQPEEDNFTAKGTFHPSAFSFVSACILTGFYFH